MSKQKIVHHVPYFNYMTHLDKNYKIVSISKTKPKEKHEGN